MKTLSPDKNAVRKLLLAAAMIAIVAPAGVADAYRPGAGASVTIPTAPTAAPIDVQDAALSAKRGMQTRILGRYLADRLYVDRSTRTVRSRRRQVSRKNAGKNRLGGPAPKTQSRNLTKTGTKKTKLKSTRKRTRAVKPKEVTATEAAALINAGDRVFVPLGHGVAQTVLDALSDRVRSGDNTLSADQPIKLVGLSNTAHPRVFDRGGKIVPSSLFLAGNTRDAVSRGQGEFVPVFLSRVPRLIEDGTIGVDKAIVHVSAPDKQGYVTLGPTAGVTLSALKKATVRIGQINNNVPRTKGSTRIHMSKLTHVVRDNRPLTPVPPAPVSDTEAKIARNIVGLIPKNPTLQFGIGGIPNAVASELAKANRKDLRVHSEMISDGVMDLVKAGAVKGKVTYSFAMGSESFLRWMDKNVKLDAKPTDHVNNPALIGAKRNVMAINSAVRVDLNGQINAQYVRKDWYSGVGGQVDFMRGAMTSRGGKAILALPATQMVKDGKGGRKMVSKIVPRLGSGDVVTTSMHDVQYIVTEFGVAHLEGKTAVERARALIDVAHPKFRGGLKRSLTRQLNTRQREELSRYEARVAAQQAEAKASKKASKRTASSK